MFLPEYLIKKTVSNVLCSSNVNFDITLILTLFLLSPAGCNSYGTTVIPLQCRANCHFWYLYLLHVTNVDTFFSYLSRNFLRMSTGKAFRSQEHLGEPQPGVDWSSGNSGKYKFVFTGQRV